MRLQDKYTRLLAGILIICMMLPIMPQVTVRVSAAERTVSTFAELVEACKTDGVISLANDIIVTDSIILTERINIEIKGNGYTLRVPTPFLEEDGTAAQAPSEHYIFYAGSRLSKLKFSDVTFMGGAKSALYVNYNCSDVTLDRIIVTRSYKAINTNSTFRMNNSIGYNNAYGVVSLMKNARALINDCSFSNNCSPSYGGAINNNGTAIVNNSTIN